jgi:hypothetical protein
MSQQHAATYGRVGGRIFIRLAIVVVSLLLIRVVVDQLPMIRRASPIVISSNLTPEQQLLLAQTQAQLAQSGQALPNYQQLAGLPGYILPVWVANAAIDTIIFAAMLLSVAELSREMRRRARRLPEAGAMLFLAVLAVVVALAYLSYQSVVTPLLGADAGLYDWFFLVFGVVPIAGLIVIGYRKLEVITDMVFHSTQRTVTGDPGAFRQLAPATCAGCGQTLTTGAKFCAGCGAPVPATEGRPTFCSACGVKNEGAAKTCVSCGAPLAAAS